MSDELDALLDRVDDAGLRSELRDQIEKLRRRRQFGLVYESHLPERVRLPDHPIRRGSRVVRRDADSNATPREVVRVKGDNAFIESDDGTEKAPRSDLVVVAEFGDPIYPGFRRLDSISRGGDKPAHVVIKGENYHALEALRFSHAGKVDCIYIDPPYNTGARDWKYDNDYVDGEDAYRHSKWLAFMERRLRLAKDLLNPDRSALIVTIDEKEYLRLGLLLEQVFAGCRIQMVSVTISPRGTSRASEFSRVDEYAFYIFVGDAALSRQIGMGDDEEVRWLYLRRTQRSLVRGSRPNQFYAVYVEPDTLKIVDIGEPLGPDDDIGSVPQVPGAVPVFPINPDGEQLIWGLTPPSLREALVGGYVRVSPGNDQQPFTIAYLSRPNIQKAERGEFLVAGTRPDGSKIVVLPGGKPERATTVWSQSRHDAGAYGTSLLRAMLPGRSFPFPKSLYAVEDALRHSVGDVRDAVVLDFFAGSGTTAHAVARLNRQDGGSRQSISVTNNEVSVEEAVALRQRGLRPGDQEWESLGIFEHVTRPRLESATTGLRPDGVPISGDYKFIDEFPMAEGFEENVEFVELRYLDIEDVELDLAFESVAPLLWMRSGGTGPMIERRCDESGTPKRFDVTDRYGVLFDPDDWRSFLEALPASASTVFVVTDSPSVFAAVAAELPSGADVVRLYENYVTTFAINRGR